MLTTLRIKNLALVADLALELPPGLIVITGETGAGKSILIGALDLVLGERADRTLIRGGADSCTVEATFDVARLRATLPSWLESNALEPCEDNQLRLKRTFTNTGANRQFINGSSTTLGLLAEAGEWLVDMHGPHDHQSLLHPARQLAILDAFGSLQPPAEALAQLAIRRGAVESAKAALIVDERTYAQQLELLRFQASEISAARLRGDEDVEVERDYHRAANAAKLAQLSQAALNLLDGDDASALAQAGGVGRLLQELKRTDPAAECLISLQEQAVSALQDLRSDLAHYAEQLELDPQKLQALEERLNLLHSLKRKYGSTLADVIAFGAEAAQKLHQLEQRDSELARLNQELQRLGAEWWRAARELSAKRRQVIPKLVRAVQKQLSDLGFKQGRFDIAINSLSAPPADSSEGPLPARGGLDSVEFQFAPNPGEPMRPLRAVASSGEMARVMLALKTVLAVEDEIPVLIFDEVDANVGGETAKAVGEKMRQIANRRQVICITHLPTVAATAEAHFLVTKDTQEGRTTTSIRPLGPAERVTELARMLGGQTESARRYAAALLGA